MKRSNKIHNAGLFTQAATEQYQKHIRTQSKQALQRINETVNLVCIPATLRTKVIKREGIILKGVNLWLIVGIIILKIMFANHLYANDDVIIL